MIDFRATARPVPNTARPSPPEKRGLLKRASRLRKDGAVDVAAEVDEGVGSGIWIGVVLGGGGIEDCGA